MVRLYLLSDIFVLQFRNDRAAKKFACITDVSGALLIAAENILKVVLLFLVPEFVLLKFSSYLCSVKPKIQSYGTNKSYFV